MGPLGTASIVSQVVSSGVLRTVGAAVELELCKGTQHESTRQAAFNGSSSAKDSARVRSCDRYDDVTIFCAGDKWGHVLRHRPVV